MDAAGNHTIFTESVVSDARDARVSNRLPKTASISLVLPAWNEAEVIGQAIDEAAAALAGITSDFEILVVDDGSTDNTRRLAEQAAAHRAEVRVLSHPHNRGYGAALRTGFAAASKDYVGFTDSDCQFHLGQLNRLVLLLASCDIACGYRIARQDNFLRLLYSKIYNMLVRLLLGVPVRDCDCALKLFRREALRDLTIRGNGFLVNAELLAQAQLQGKRIVEVGVDHRPRPRGTSTVSVWHVPPVLLSLLQFWWSHIQFPSRRDRRHRAEDSWTTGRSWSAGLLLTTICSCLFLLHLSYPLLEPDENRYSQIALEMVQSGDYLIPRLWGEPYLDKPPLLYWATAASFQIFGTNEVAARLVPALAACWTVLTLFVLGARLIGPRTAWIAALLLLSCAGFVLAGRYLIMDSLLTCFTTTSLLAALHAIHRRRLHWGWWIVSAIACGLGLMTKGPVAAILVLPPLILLPRLSQQVARTRIWPWLVYIATLLAITSPWFIVMFVVEPDFAQYFLWKHNVMRFVAAFDHQAPFWYYIPVLLIGMFPCSLLTAPAVAFLLGRSSTARQARTVELGGIALAAVWVLFFFSASSCKLPTYVLPAVPLLCCIAAFPLSAIWNTSAPRLPLARLTLQLPPWAMTAVLLVGSGLAIASLLFPRELGLATFWSWVILSITAGYFTLLCLRVCMRQRASLAGATYWQVTAATSLLVMAFSFQAFVPRLADVRSMHASAARLQAQTGPPVLPVAYLDWQLDSQALYFPERSVKHFTQEHIDQLATYARAQRELIVVGHPDGAQELKTLLGESAVITRMPGGRGRLYLITPSSKPQGVLTARRGTGQR